MKSAVFSAAGALALASGCGVAKAQAPDAAPSQVVITAKTSVADINPAPVTAEGIDADQIARTINAVTVEDQLKFLPNVLIRQRHIGDTQDPITTRTSGVGASARSLVYADGVLLSALIGNNNTNASPRWGMVAPGEVERIDVMYGPFAAAFPGNSIGEVVEITTRMPDHLEASASLQGAWQDFSLYGTRSVYPTSHEDLSVGDRIGRWAWRLDYNHLQSRAQPLTFATATVPSAASTTGTPVTGAFSDASRLGVPIAVLGATALEDQSIDNAKIKLTYDLTSTVKLAYSFSYFANHDDASVQSYLKDSNGAPVYTGAVNIAGRPYSLAASTFSNSVYHLREQHFAQSLSAASNAGGVFDWEAVITGYDFHKDEQNNPTTALPSAAAGGPGAQTSLGGTGWITADLKGFWRPEGVEGMNLFSFGLHEDRFVLSSPKSNLTDWQSGQVSSLAGFSAGKTETQALWGQDRIKLTSKLTLTLGARVEHWRALAGVNYSSSPALNIAQPSLSADRISPKAVLAWTPDPAWRLGASFGQAFRFPTVTELYQTVATGAVLTSPNPNLRPENAQSGEMSVQRNWAGGRARLSYFEEHISDALISQSAPLVAGSNTLYSYVQNVPRTLARGVEIVASQDNLLIRGLQLTGWATYVDARTVSDPAFPGAVGKSLPQLPHLRGAVVATYSPTPKLSLTLDGRYSARSHGVIDNSDGYANTYQGFSGYFVMDARIDYRFSDHWEWSLGVDNLNDRKYFEFHPFPQRTVSAQLRWRL